MTIEVHADQAVEDVVDSIALDDHVAERPRVVVIGAGPAGLTAAWELVARGLRPVVLEADEVVGGISRTVKRDGWRFDIGGHRFFTKVADVEALWRCLLPGADLLTRSRLSRIFYNGKFFDYPLKPANALRNLGLLESARCLLSYARAKLNPPADTSSFEGWVASRFGNRLYRTFFKTYTEKVWGVPATTLQADWAAQRIKSMSLGAAIRDALGLQKGPTVTSLIDEFLYPRLGPGMMWERCCELVAAAGATVAMSRPVAVIHRGADAAVAVETTEGERWQCDAVISSMPLGDLVLAMQPPAPRDVQAAAGALRHRDFMTVALVVPETVAFPDNWIYIHSPEVRLGRIQNFGAWSPDMVQPGSTCLGLEYFVNIGDDLWEMDDDAVIRFAVAELATIGLCAPSDVRLGYVTRVPKAYPVYDETYREHVDTIRQWLRWATPNVHAVGRNGMHRYNNQDHSMMTAMLAVANVVDGTDHDLWAVNVDDEYHEEHAGSSPAGTGRAAPVLR